MPKSPKPAKGRSIAQNIAISKTIVQVAIAHDEAGPGTITQGKK